MRNEYRNITAALASHLLAILTWIIWLVSGSFTTSAGNRRQADIHQLPADSSHAWPHQIITRTCPVRSQKRFFSSKHRSETALTSGCDDKPTNNPPRTASRHHLCIGLVAAGSGCGADSSGCETWPGNGAMRDVYASGAGDGSGAETGTAAPDILP